MKKLQNFVRGRINISKLSEMKIIQILKNWKELKKDLKVYYEICELFEKRAFEEKVFSAKCFFFKAKFKSFFDFLTSGLDFGNFSKGEVWRAPKCLSGFVDIYWMVGDI